MVDDAEVRVGIVFIWFHNLSPGVAHSRWLAIEEATVRTGSHLETRADDSSIIDTSTLLFFCALFEEDLAQNVLFLAESVIVFYIVVVRLVKHAI